MKIVKQQQNEQAREASKQNQTAAKPTKDDDLGTLETTGLLEEKLTRRDHMGEVGQSISTQLHKPYVPYKKRSTERVRGRQYCEFIEQFDNYYLEVYQKLLLIFLQTSYKNTLMPIFEDNI